MDPTAAIQRLCTKGMWIICMTGICTMRMKGTLTSMCWR